MRMVDLIEKKRDGHELSAEEIEFIIQGYTKDEIPDYQVSAWAMSVFFRDMTDRERADLTMAMVNSGDSIDLSDIAGVKVDKHSTGGVGDTTTLVLAPLVAAAACLWPRCPDADWDIPAARSTSWRRLAASCGADEGTVHAAR